MGAPYPADTTTTRHRTHHQTRRHHHHRRRPQLVGLQTHQSITPAPSIRFHRSPNSKKNKSSQNPSSESKRELIRRAYFDLWGLPPTAQEVDRFAADPSDRAYENLIDKLLSSPRYGERWARYWLDIVRYAQTNGYERDSEKPYAWRYRDYVIRALNQDKPYDQFIREQLAGDEIENVTDDSLIATGFYRLGVWDDEPDDKKAADFDYLDDNLRTISTAFLGLTVGCARCHEHKFDPIPQSDYYSLLAFLRNIKPHDKPVYSADSATFVPLGDRAKVQAWLIETDTKLKEIKVRSRKSRQGNQKETRSGNQRPRRCQIRFRLGPGSPRNRPNSDQDTSSPSRKCQRPRSRSQTDISLGPWRSASHLQTDIKFHRPSHSPSPTGSSTKTTPSPPASSSTASGNTISVVESFPPPTTSAKPASLPLNPELLDFLASSFIDDGWSIKKLHRLIMLSRTYQLSSRASNESANQLDPDNQFLWRQSMHRLEAESIRDSILQVSGQLNETQGGRGFFPRLTREVIAGGSRPGDGWELSLPDELNRRSIYSFIKRTMSIPMLDTFDTTNSALPTGERTTTTVAPQALMLMNDRFIHEKATALAQKIITEVGDDLSAQINRAYQLALSRKPTPRELSIAIDYLQRQSSAFEILRNRLHFEPDVPSAVFNGYLKKLSASDLLFGPRAGWKYARGTWGGGYEGIFNVDPAQGPVALADGSKFLDGSVKGNFLINSGCEYAGLLARGKLTGDELTSAYDLVLAPKQQSIFLRRHDKKEIRILAAAGFPVLSGEWHNLKLTTRGPKLLAYADNKLILSATDPDPLPPGDAGIRIWGASLQIDSPSITRNNTDEPLFDGQNRLPRERALAAFAAVLFNLNEFVYVD
jgi:hypothetical protein